MASPNAVLAAIVHEWKLSGYSYSDAAEMLGYTNKQSLITFLYRLRKSQTYFSAKHAEKFHDTFGFDVDFLTQGLGDIYPIHDQLYIDYSEGDSDPLYNFTDDQILALLQIASTVISYSSDEQARKVWEAIIRKNLKDYCDSMRELIKTRTGKFMTGQDLFFIAQRICK